MNDLRGRAPKAVRIANLSGKGDSMMLLEGLALSYEAIHLFVNLLEQSENIDSASLLRRKRIMKILDLSSMQSVVQLPLKEGEITGAD